MPLFYNSRQPSPEEQEVAQEVGWGHSTVLVLGIEECITSASLPADNRDENNHSTGNFSSQAAKRRHTFRGFCCSAAVVIYVHRLRTTPLYERISPLSVPTEKRTAISDVRHRFTVLVAPILQYCQLYYYYYCCCPFFTSLSHLIAPSLLNRSSNRSAQFTPRVHSGSCWAMIADCSLRRCEAGGGGYASYLLATCKKAPTTFYHFMVKQSHLSTKTVAGLEDTVRMI